MKSIQEILSQSLPSMTFLRSESCDGCGFTVKVYETEIIGGPRKGEKTEVKYGCKCEDMKLAKKALENKKKAENKKVKEYFEFYSNISKRLKEATFNNYIPQNDSQRKAKQVVLNYIKEFDINKPRNLLFTGECGVGKSHLAKVIADGVMKKENPETETKYTAIFINVPKLKRKIRSTYDSDSEISENEVFETLENVDLLVLDDLGAEKQSEWTMESIFDIVEGRQGKNTIYTSNLNEQELLVHFGDRIGSRVLNEDTRIINIEGKNYRLA